MIKTEPASPSSLFCGFLSRLIRSDLHFVDFRKNTNMIFSLITSRFFVVVFALLLFLLHLMTVCIIGLE